jgi:hypothetical protein
MIGLATQWAFLPSLGPRELIIVAAVMLVLYGRSGVGAVRTARTNGAWWSPFRARSGARSDRSPWESRTFWFLTIVAAAAVSAWVVTRTLILGASGVSH